jgi:hypothetical protein
MTTDIEDEILDAPSFTKGPSTEQSLKLTEMANNLAQVEDDIDELERQLEEKKKLKQEITMKEMPDFMKLIGQDRIGLPDRNCDVVMEPFYHANIKAEWPEEQREAAFKWLEESKNGDMIKIEMVFLFPKTMLLVAQWVAGQVAKLKIPASFKTKEKIPEPTIKKTVPWNTLTAFVKRQVEAGKECPLEVLGATVGSVVKVKPRK